MARNRGLGIGKDSLFKNTVKPNLKNPNQTMNH